jgi:hypothetical protein
MSHSSQCPNLSGESIYFQASNWILDKARLLIDPRMLILNLYQPEIAEHNRSSPNLIIELIALISDLERYFL